MLILFWGSIAAVAYAYFGYPAILGLLARVAARKGTGPDDTSCPRVTLVITAHNEEDRIRKKLENTLAIAYPADRLEVLVASDASTDRTDAIVREYASEGIRLVRAPERRGKEYAQKCAIREAKGEIIVFSDVATMLEPGGVSRIVSNFADPTVGCVSSEDRVVDDHGNVSGEGAYVRYEMWLRSLETRVNSVVGLSGSFFAARAEVCSDWPTTIPSDFNTLLNAVRLGLRGISDPKSTGIYPVVRDRGRERERAVRTITRGISALMANKTLMNPLEYGFFSWQLISHKFLRWLVPWFMVAALAANAALALRGRAYRVLLAGQCIFYLVAALGARSDRASLIVKVPQFFVQANLSILLAWLKYLRGERYVTWTPSGRL